MRRTLSLLGLVAAVMALGAVTARQGRAAPLAQATPVHGVLFETYGNYN